MYYGVIYWQNDTPSYLECQTEEEVWRVFNNTPQPLDSTAQAIIAGRIARERYEPL